MYLDFSRLEFADSARRHGIAEHDARHACRNAIRIFHRDGILMLIGADYGGRMLEVGITTRGEDPRIVHAMPARAHFLR